jgi:hypothetical protein
VSCVIAVLDQIWLTSSRGKAKMQAVMKNMRPGSERLLPVGQLR